jgi:IS30 family transposase
LKPFSITGYNSCEFSKHEKINNLLNTKSYFCKPYHSWKKGTVENINDLIRRFFPKGTDFDKIPEEEIAYVEDWINNRPMKILNYMSPKQKLQHFGVAIAS